MKANKNNNRFKVVFFENDSLEELFSFNVSNFKLFIISFLVILLISTLTILTIFLSPVKDLIPGYLPSSFNSDFIALSLRTDSIENDINLKNQQLSNIKTILMGEDFIDTLENNTLNNIDFEKLSLNPTPADSIFRLNVERESRFNLSSEPNEKSSKFKELVFFPPLKGIIIDSFNISENHFGIDILSPKNEPIKSCLDGTVIISNWTKKTGYTIIIQHEYNLISVYKHNSILLKEIGQNVKSGDVIAIIGNSGSDSTGPHLHFELWHNGIPINPIANILF